MYLDLKTHWTQEELVELIAEIELLGKTDFAGTCRTCKSYSPALIRCVAKSGLTTACPQCHLDYLKSFELLQLQWWTPKV